MSATIIHKTIYLPEENFVIYFPRRATGKQLAKYLAPILNNNKVSVVEAGNSGSAAALEDMDDNKWASFHTILVAMPGEFNADAARVFAPLASADKAHVISCEELTMSKRQYKKWRKRDRTFPYRQLETDMLSGLSTAPSPRSSTRVRFGDNDTLRFAKLGRAWTVGQSPTARKQQWTQLKQTYGAAGRKESDSNGVTVYRAANEVLIKFRSQSLADAVSRSSHLFMPQGERNVQLRVVVYPTVPGVQALVTAAELRLGLSLSALKALHAYFDKLAANGLTFVGTDLGLCVRDEDGSVRMLFPVSLKEMSLLHKKRVTALPPAYAMFNVDWHVSAAAQDSINRHVLSTFHKSTRKSTATAAARAVAATVADY